MYVAIDSTCSVRELIWLHSLPAMPWNQYGCLLCMQEVPGLRVDKRSYLCEKEGKLTQMHWGQQSVSHCVQQYGH